MKLLRGCFMGAALMLLVGSTSLAQKPKTTKTVKKPVTQKVVKPATPAPTPHSGDATQDEKQVRDMIAFLEYVLNTLGSSSTASRDKDVLITQSYSKIFRDADVQIEDDLDEDREIATRKSVMAYLKDVDFFFNDVHFEFTIDKIEKGENVAQLVFYKVSLKRNLKGTTTDGKAVNNSATRYVEVNYDPKAQDLKIVSIYTHEIDERDALLNWWKQLSLEWQTILRTKLSIKRNAELPDSIGYSEIQDMIAFTSLDLSNNHFLQTIGPLDRLTNLEVLNLSHTGIADITPLRNLTALQELDISNTPVSDLSPLRYSDKLEKLNASSTSVSEVSVLEKMPLMKELNLSRTGISQADIIAGLPEIAKLDISRTAITNLSFAEKLGKLSELSCAGTKVSDLSPVKSASSLTILNVDSTQVNALVALSSLSNLKLLYVNGTSVEDLSPLAAIPHLEKVYCDHSGIKREAADDFMTKHPKVLVIYDTDDLQSWWTSLSPEWQTVLAAVAHITTSPSKEELAGIPGLDSINIEGQHINDLNPVKRMLGLRILLAARTGVSDLTPLADLSRIQIIDVSETDVVDLSVLERLTKLKTFRADKTKIENIHSLYASKTLSFLYVDQTAIHDITAQEFLEKNPTCLLIYKTIHLNRWWSKLPSGWKEVFQQQMGTDSSSTRENLHRLVERKKFQFKDAPVTDLSALNEFVQLQELSFASTSIADLAPLNHFTQLTSLHAVSSPISQIESLRSIMSLLDLDISNTSVDDLKPLEGLSNLKQLNCAGTQIKKLDPLKNLALVFLDCSNTRVSNLDPVDYPSLKTLKCFNTKVSTREMESFKKKNAGCNVIYYR